MQVAENLIAPAAMPALAPVGGAASVAPLRVAYLFGAGATHAELMHVLADKMADELFLSNNSLLLGSVSKRVCRDAKRDGDFSGRVRWLLSRAGLSNIEMFVSLLEENNLDATERLIQKLKTRLREDIEQRIRRRKKRFILHKALLEFHRSSDREQVVGFISLNYDRLLDEAYEEILGRKPDYGFLPTLTAGASLPLLKLHGGFGLRYRNKRLPIITPGVNKNYLTLPYNFVWGRALEVLIDSDVLRIVGCSLSTNDLGVIDLLFKAHVSRRQPLLLQLIDFDPPNNTIKEDLGFFPTIERATEIEGRLITDVDISNAKASTNPFKIWLKAKIAKAMDPAVLATSTYARQVMA